MSYPVLSIIIFLPLLGALLMLLLGRNDRLVKWLAAVFTFVPFVLAVVLFAVFDRVCRGSGLPVRGNGQLDRPLHQLSPRRRRPQPAPRRPDRLPRLHGRPHLLEGTYPGAGVFRLAAHPGSKHSGCLRFPRPCPLLPLLGSRGHSHVLPDLDLGFRAQGILGH